MLAALLALATTPGLPYALDQSRTTLAFRAEQAILGSTDGVFHRVSGELELDEADVKLWALKVVVKTASIDTGNNKRDDHLKKKDFFHTEKYPTMTFISSKVSGTGDNVVVTGTLRIKDKEVGVQFPLQLEWSGDGPERRVRARGGFELDRYAAGLDYDTPFYIPEISRMIRLHIDATALQQSLAPTPLE